jgi:hypothetical protein
MYISQLLTFSLALLAVQAHTSTPAKRSPGKFFEWFENLLHQLFEPKAPPPPQLSTMPSQSPLAQPHSPRLVMYQQTHHDAAGKPISLLPLLTHKTGVTHVYIAAIHLNGGANVTLNDHAPGDGRHDVMWDEVRQLQDAGVKVMAMLGGAAKGSFERLSGSDESVRFFTKIPLFSISKD